MQELVVDIAFLQLYNTDGYGFDEKYGGEYGMNDATIEYERSIDKSINYSKTNTLLQEFE